MGIHDRDYVRRDQPRGGGIGAAQVGMRSMRMWSVTTWLIVICVAVFVIDGFLPTRPVLMFEDLQNKTIDDAALVEGGDVVQLMTRGGRPQIVRRTLYLKNQVDPSTGQPLAVGYRRYNYMPPLEAVLHFSTDRGFFAVQFWRLIGFQFLHSHDTIAHLLFNMIGLYFFGPMVERYLGSKRYLAFYLLCGICGALMYVLLNLGGFIVQDVLKLQISIPGLLFNETSTPLVGASAGVFGILMAGAFLAPDATVLLFFVLPMRLRTLAYGLVVVAVIAVLWGWTNAGGQAGHLGGALAGFYFIRHPHHLHGFFDFLGWADPTSHHYRGRRGGRIEPTAKRPGGAEIDRILDKVHREGLRSLTARERRILREASDGRRD